ncbi:MAG: hypothetical protein IK020_03630 [Clostridiales bacterium]|nr:hypothetical protein [Clostridiales bacterium]
MTDTYYRDFENEQWFLETIRKPAQAFLASDEGHEWVSAHFASDFVTRLYSQMDAPLCRIYIIRYKAMPLYRGESVKTYARLGDHIFHMHEDLKNYFGLAEDELKWVTFEVGAVSYPDIKERREKELELIRKEFPILQGRNHRCILKKDRYEAVRKWYNNRDEVEMAVETAVFGPGRYCIEWRDFVHGNPCLRWSEQKLDETIATRVSQYIDALDVSERRKLLKQMAANLGSSNYVHTAMAKLILTRLFDDGNDDLEGFYSMLRFSSGMIRKNLRSAVK